MHRFARVRDRELLDVIAALDAAMDDVESLLDEEEDPKAIPFLSASTTLALS